MRIFISLVILLAFCVINATRGMQVHPRPPGLSDGQKQINKPLDAPVEYGSKVPDLAKLKQEAQELAQLSAGIPPRIDFVAKGQLPKDLADQLKRIEKLARQMHSEISR
jgi:hypothetical protein